MRVNSTYCQRKLVAPQKIPEGQPIAGDRLAFRFYLQDWPKRKRSWPNPDLNAPELCRVCLSFLKKIDMRKRWIYISFPFILIFSIYFLGPEPSRPKWNPSMPSVPSEPAALEDYVRQQESKHKLKPDNEARIIWADSSKRKTEYSVVYLHGFSASQKKVIRFI
jgi:hypothetical protein